MKILQVVRQYLPSTGGMETYVSSLCRELEKHGVRADVATLDYRFKSDERLPAYERVGETNVIRLPSWGTPRYFLAPRLIKLLPRYDLVHVHGVDFFIDLLGALRKVHGKPVVLSTHGGFFHTAWLPAIKKTYFKTVTRAAVRGVDRVIASSPQDEELFRQISGRVTLVENGIDYQKFAKVKKEASNSRLLFVGRISKNKRVDRLIEALARLRDAVPQARLVIAGPDWEGLADGLKQKATQLGIDGAIEFKGALTADELLEELAKARLFVSASQYEAFGLSTVEAMAAGTIPVVNRIRAFEDIVDEGQTGFLTDFGDADHAAETLRKALELSDKEVDDLGKRARKSAARYDWQSVAGQIVDIYQEVLSSKGSKTRGTPPGSLDLLGARVDRVDQHEALARISSFMDRPGLEQVVTLNPEYVMLAHQNPGLLGIINNSALCVPDGVGVVWACRLLGKPLRERVAGSDLLPEICRLSASKGLGVFFLGGRPGVAELAARELKNRFPELKVAGTSGNDPNPYIDIQTIEEINASGAQVLAVAYGCPKQDYWIDRNREALTSVRMAIGVGGSFDFVSGEIPRAPWWMRRAGLEWLYRLWLEPTRLKRMLALPRFGGRVLKEMRQNRDK